MDEIKKFNNGVEDEALHSVCEVLMDEIAKGLPNATVKIWHAIPVWFIKDNPVVGYGPTKRKGVNLLFWSGQAFNEPGLTPEGSFRAAEIKYTDAQQIDTDKLQKWLSEASVKIYNYKDIRKNRGVLTLI